jgi:NADH-quinone oxidoreductase subunit M
MNPQTAPWLELAITAGLVGSPIISLLRTPTRAFRWGLAFTGASFLFALLSWLNFYVHTPPEMVGRWSVQPWLFGRTLFSLDELSAPLVPAVALLHFLTALATATTHMRRFSFSWSLASGAIRLATFSCRDPWPLILLLSLSTIPPYIELLNRKRPTRLYLIHMGAFVGLLVLGQAAVSMTVGNSGLAPWWAILPLLAAVLIRTATVPAHCWLTDWFEHASFGIALLYVIPLTGVYATVRLVLPIAPGWVLSGIGLMSLATAIYAAGMATIQRDTRRFFANLLLSHASLVLVGLELHTELSLTGSLAMWFSVIVSLGGFGLMLRAVEARFGRLSLAEYHGLYEHSPMLAVCFLVTGLASVGFPGTLGFISADLLVDSCIEANPLVGVGVVAAAALNGIAVMRAYFLLFTGTRHASTVKLGLGIREQIAVLTLTVLIFGGGLYPQPGIATRFRAAEEIVNNRRIRQGEKPVESVQPEPKAPLRKSGSE